MNHTNRHDYNERKDSWYSPKEIIIRFESVRKVYGNTITSDPLFKKAREMYTGALALAGAYELSEENNYYMQLNTQTESPDVVAVRLVEKINEPVNAEIVQMEIVEFEEHSKTNDLVEFLKINKLPPRKIYDEETMIICLVNKEIPINMNEISSNLNNIIPKIQQNIYIIGRGVYNSDDFYIFSPYPKQTKVIKFDILNTLNKYKLYPRIRLFKGVNEKIEFTETQEEVLSTYEILGLEKDKLYKKYPDIANKFTN